MALLEPPLAEGRVVLEDVSWEFYERMLQFRAWLEKRQARTGDGAIPMVIRESDGQLDISGTPADLAAIADQLERLSAGGFASFRADASADPRPYRRSLAALDVRITDGPARVALSGDRVVVTRASR